MSSAAGARSRLTNQNVSRILLLHLSSQLTCQRKLTDGTYNPKKDRVCYNLLDKIVAATKVGGKGPSQYDNRMWVSSQGEFPPGKARVEQYLGNSDSSKRAALMSQIHAEKNEQYGQRYKECTDPPYFALQKHDGDGVVADITDVLEAGVKIMFFNGMNDIICNHLGNEKVLDRLVWSGGEPGWGGARTEYKRREERGDEGDAPREGEESSEYCAQGARSEATVQAILLTYQLAVLIAPLVSSLHH